MIRSHDLMGLTFAHLTFLDCNFIDIDFRQTNFISCDFTNCNFTETIFFKSELDNCNFTDYQKCIDKRILIKPRNALIIHTDRGTQFTSSEYHEFITINEDFIVSSMSRKAKPKDNPIAERFMRTFKNHKIDEKTFQQELHNQLENNSRFRGFRKIFNIYVKSINMKPNAKSNNKSPEQHDGDSIMASMLMVEPTYSKTLSPYYGEDFRRKDIDNYKS